MEAQWCESHENRKITEKCVACDFTGCIVCATVHDLRSKPPHKTVKIVPSVTLWRSLLNLKNFIKRKIKQLPPL